MRGLMSTVLGMVIVVAAAGSAQADTIYASRAAYDAAHLGGSFETWDSYASGTTITNGSSLNGITYFSSSGDAVVNSSFLPSSSPNGLGRTPIDFFLGTDTITFVFANPITSFGIDINTFDAGTGGYVATTNLGTFFGSFYDPFPSFTTGQFLGFDSVLAFNSVTISAPSQTVFTLDTMRFSSSVPEPASLALFGLGAMGAAALKRRRAKPQA